MELVYIYGKPSDLLRMQAIITYSYPAIKVFPPFPLLNYLHRLNITGIIFHPFASTKGS